MRKQPSNAFLLGSLLVAIVAASTASIFIRFAQTAAPSLVIATFRLAIASLVLWPWMLFRSPTQLRTFKPTTVTLSLLSGALLAVHFGTWISSLAYTSIASSAVLVAMAPLFVALLAPLTLREPLTRTLSGGLALAFFGTLLIAWSDLCGGAACLPAQSMLGGEAWVGDLLALAGAVSGAGYMILGRRVRLSVTLLPYISVTYGTAALGLLAATMWAGLPLTGYPPVAYLWFALLAIFPQLIAHSTYNWALGYLPAALVALSFLGEPVGAAALGYAIFGEIPSPLKLLGAVLILAGIFIATRAPDTSRRSMPAQGGA
jgi:drug/metabolite transporter (DMT)-like permease